MKKFIVFVLICFIFLPGYKKPENKEYHLKVNSSVQYQTIDGFGASDAWRCQFVGKNWPLKKREQIADWLFSTETDENGNPKGIGLSIWRFYLAAGTAEQGELSGIKNPWRRGESFLSPDGTWDWSKYQGQRWFLNAARDRGVEKFLAFTIAPPVQYTLNGKGFADKENQGFNVQPDKVTDYASYLAKVLKHFQDEEGIEFDYISPFNEPQWDWDQGNQEGTPANNSELFEFMGFLSKELVKQNLETLIVPGEAATIDHLTSFVKNDERDNQMATFFSKSSPMYLGDLPNMANIISGHSYFTVWPLDSQIVKRQRLAHKMQAVNPEIGYWQSEYCILQKNDEIGGGWERDLGMATALYVARIIHNDLTICNARSWQWWTALTQFDFKDGLVYLDSGTDDQPGEMGADVESLKYDGTARSSKLMWVLGNYSRFVRPGMKRIEVELSGESKRPATVMASAYINPETSETVVVAINTEDNEVILDNLFEGNAKNKRMYLTSDEKNLAFSKIENDKVILPPKSVATICFSRHQD
jgi:O-glycosyl hydrolase